MALATGAPGPRAEVDVALAVRRFRPWYWFGAALLVLAGAQLIQYVIRNPRFEWRVVGTYLFDPTVLVGVRTTLVLTAVGMALGIVLGIVVAAARMGPLAPLRALAVLYSRFFLSVPLLVQLLFWYNLAYLSPRLSLGIPFGPSFGNWDTNSVVTPLTAALLGLALHEGAYMSEVVRAGLLSVHAGQRDAAMSLGLRGQQTFLRVVLPQAMRFIVPPTGNQIIGMLKGTSLLSIIGMTELLHSVQNIYSRTFEVVPMLIVACLWYFAIVSVLEVGQRLVERRFGRSVSRPGRPRRIPVPTAGEV